MKINYNINDFIAAKPKTKLSLLCYNCNQEFFAQKKNILYEQKNNRGRLKFCSWKCRNEYITTKTNVVCTNCDIIFQKELNQQKKSKNNFCSRSCNITYNNLHKKYGIRISKLEKYLQEELIKQYDNLEFLFNYKTIINSELDIYIPSIKLAFELNGIFHYEPIYGQEKLIQIQNNDQRKFQACVERDIELCIIDTSEFKNFKLKKAEKYLNIITMIINLKLQ